MLQKKMDTDSISVDDIATQLEHGTEQGHKEFKTINRKKTLIQNMDSEDTASVPINRPNFPPASAQRESGDTEFRRIPIPPNRFSPLKENWMKIFTPIAEQLKLQIRLNLKNKSIELRVSPRSLFRPLLSLSGVYI